MAPRAPQRSLKAWTNQKWRTKSGNPSTQGPKATGERYLPEKAIKALSKKEYAETTAAKRRASIIAPRILLVSILKREVYV